MVDMTDCTIRAELRDMEYDNNIDILFAVEAGSRVWGMSSNDSDYDVRFVFKRPREEYLKLNKLKDVIVKTIKNRDYVGFDIYKTCGLINSSNPSIIEWLQSDIVYYGKQPEELIKVSKNFNPLALYHHYLSMGKQNYLKYIKSGEKITYKKYLYAMRGIINSFWVKEYNSLPLINFPNILAQIFSNEQKTISNEIINRLFEIIALKKQGLEKDIIENEKNFDLFIENYLKTSEPPKPRKNLKLVDDLNNYILKIID